MQTNRYFFKANVLYREKNGTTETVSEGVNGLWTSLAPA